jgi:hypothetical protein
VRAALAALLLLFVTACDGGGGNGSPPPDNTPPPVSQDPCASVRSELLQAPPDGVPAKTRGIDADPRWRVLDALWLHEEARLRRRTPSTFGPAAATASDIGEISVLRDEGDLVLPANSYDLRGVGLRFSRNGAGGYDIGSIPAGFRTALGTRLTLADDDSAPADVAFAFPFYGASQRTAFVNSDGNITFEQGDNASTDRNVARMLTGPPRVSLFFADLDPSTAGGVFVNAAADQHVVTWCNVRGFESTDTTSVQAALLPDGTIELRYAAGITLGEAIVGLSPGRTSGFRTVDLSSQGTIAGGSGAVGERFSPDSQIDTVSVARTFFATHPDSYDQLVIWTDARIIQDAFAFETTVANEIRGIGQDVFDFSRDFGSAGRLRSYTVMDFVGKYPDDPRQRFLGEDSTLAVLAHETGHRWLALFNFLDHNRQRSDAILGRQRAHWSYFMDSDASVMEGNDIEDLQGGSFRTAAAGQRYSLLDQYAMGLVPASEVPPFFYVENPTNLSKSKDRESDPESGVTFNGTRRDVLIDDIVAVHGPRQPSSAESTRVHRQAFLYLVGAGRSPDNAQVAKLERIRRQWEEFFVAATDGRMRVETRLQQ